MYKTVECSPPGAAPAFRMPVARSHSWSMVVMIKQHLKQNVYEAFLERLKFIFEEFDNIYGISDLIRATAHAREMVK